ncbi:hypothetical protein GCM10017673_33870 [Streptosporangium violaceochromogenes]|nr:hypothetical protein GCM10017673_33870 [Streptosporangium violaceochromogenes]
MRITDQTAERFQAESRLRKLTAPGLPGPFDPGAPRLKEPDGCAGDGAREGPGGRGDGPRSAALPEGPAAGVRSTPAPPFLTVLRTAIAERSSTWAPSGRSGLRALLVVALLAVAVGGAHAWWSRPEPEPVASPTPVSGSLPPMSSLPPASPSGPPARPAATGGAALTTAGEVVVHVTGKVRRPGVITLPVGSRVADALRAAGGVRAGAGTGPLNLARRLVDGEQVVVDPAARATTPAPVSADPAAAVLDLNTATSQQLEQLPGVGEVLARRITEYRDTHGGFRAVEQLREISGIGEPISAR